MCWHHESNMLKSFEILKDNRVLLIKAFFSQENRTFPFYDVIVCCYEILKHCFQLCVNYIRIKGFDLTPAYKQPKIKSSYISSYILIIFSTLYHELVCHGEQFSVELDTLHQHMTWQRNCQYIRIVEVYILGQILFQRIENVNIENNLYRNEEIWKYISCFLGYTKSSVQEELQD